MAALSVRTLLLHAQGRRRAAVRGDVRGLLRGELREASRASRRTQGRREGEALRKRLGVRAARELPVRRPLGKACRTRRTDAALSGAEVKARGGGALRRRPEASAPEDAAPHRNRHKRGGRGHTRHVHRPHAALPQPRHPALRLILPSR